MILELEPMTYTANPGTAEPGDVVRAAFPAVPPIASGIEPLLAALNDTVPNYCAVYVPFDTTGPRRLVLGMHADAADGNTAEEMVYLVTPSRFGGVESIELRRIASSITWTCGPTAVTAALGAPSATHKHCKGVAVTSTGWLEALVWMGPTPLNEAPAAVAVPFIPSGRGVLRVVRKITGTSWRPCHARFG